MKRKISSQRKKYTFKKVGSKTKLRILFDERNVDRKAFCEATGLHNSSVSELINGRVNYTMRILHKVCAYLNCTPNDVIDFEAWLPGRRKEPTPVS